MTLRDIRRHIGQLLIAGFSGQVIPTELRALAREFDLGGVILFARNVSEPIQVAELAREVRSLATDVPLWVSVDQEGGRVARLGRPFTEWPPMMTLGRSGDVELARRFARALAAELRSVGVTLDYAPVLDVHTNASNPVIGDRALSDRAEDVARLGVAIIEALQVGGVAACGKHFPGHGDASVDSHVDLPVLEHAPDRLHAVELMPFRDAIQAGVASIMTGHLLIPALDEEYPATLSRRILTGLLREELGYDGLILSDDLEMGAMTRQRTVCEATSMAIAAGCDGVLVCGADQTPQVAALEAVIHAVESQTLAASRVEDAMSRQVRIKAQFMMAQPAAPMASAQIAACLDAEEHRAVAEEMGQFA